MSGGYDGTAGARVIPGRKGLPLSEAEGCRRRRGGASVIFGVVVVVVEEVVDPVGQTGVKLPLDPETAIEAILATGPHRDEDEPEGDER